MNAERKRFMGMLAVRAAMITVALGVLSAAMNSIASRAALIVAASIWTFIALYEGREWLRG